MVAGFFTVRTFILGGLVFLLIGCARPDVTTYSEVKPKLDLREYMNGKLFAYGTIHDFTGKQNSHFTVDIVGEWVGNKGTLTEYFLFDDGRTERRVWELTYTDDNNFTATAGDVIGPAKGKQYGNSVNMKYTLRREIDGETYDFNMDDWMYRIDEKHLINKTNMKKLGVTVAELTIGFVKE